VREIRRLLHDYMNVLTSVNGFLDLAVGEPERAKRYEYMKRARRELTRAINLARELRQQIETTFGEGSADELEDD
jgi:sugar phosphate isomerase/epimerase